MDNELLVFGTTTCAPCKLLCSELDNLGVRYQKKMIDANVEDNDEAKEYGICGNFPVVVLSGVIISKGYAKGKTAAKILNRI